MTQLLHGVTPWRRFIQGCDEDWAVLHAGTDPPPDLSPEWFKSIVESRQLDLKHIHVAWARLDGKLSAVWPLKETVRQKAGASLRVLQSLQNLECHHAGFLNQPGLDGAGFELLQAIRDSELVWDFIEVHRVRAGSVIEEQLYAAARHCGFGIASHVVLNNSPFLTLNGDWQAYLARRSANFRRSIKKRLKRATGMGRFEIRRYDRDSREAFFPLLLEIERHTWKQAQGTSMACQDWELQFYQRITSMDPGRYVFEGEVALLDDVPLAHFLSLRHRDVLLCLKHSFRMDHSPLSLGRILTAAVLQQAHDSGIRMVDFLGNAEDHKLTWTQEMAEHRDLRVYSRRLRGRLLYLYERLRG